MSMLVSFFHAMLPAVSGLVHREAAFFILQCRLSLRKGANSQMTDREKFIAAITRLLEDATPEMLEFIYYFLIR